MYLKTRIPWDNDLAEGWEEFQDPDSAQPPASGMKTRSTYTLSQDDTFPPSTKNTMFGPLGYKDFVSISINIIPKLFLLFRFFS